CVCFFFQAEDGIRDFHVTGVQTCALPISIRAPNSGCVNLRSSRSDFMRFPRFLLNFSKSSSIQTKKRIILKNKPNKFGWFVFCRSEERRVGKECRSRWWQER